MEFGNIEFNNGLKESIYAYHIKEIHILSIPLSLKELKENYDFYPPQKYIYLKIILNCYCGILCWVT